MSIESLEVSPQAADVGVEDAAAWIIETHGPIDGRTLPASEIDKVVGRIDLTSEEPGYRKILERLGHPDVQPAGQKLRRLVCERGWRSYGILVDACNLVALKYGAGTGLHDVSWVDEPGQLYIWLSDGGDLIRPAFGKKERKIPAGDLVYGLRLPTRVLPMAWLGKRDVDAAEFQVGDRSTRVLVVALGYPGCGSDYTQSICEETYALIQSRVPGAEARHLPLTPSRT